MFLKKKNILILVAVSALLTAVSMRVNFSTLSENKFVTMGYLFATVYALTVFVVVRYICHHWKISGFLEKVLCFAGAGAFGTYLIEIQLRDFFFPVYVSLGPWIHAYPAALVWTGICVLTGMLLANLFKRIPVLGKLI